MNPGEWQPSSTQRLTARSSLWMGQNTVGSDTVTLCGECLRPAAHPGDELGGPGSADAEFPGDGRGAITPGEHLENGAVAVAQGVGPSQQVGAPIVVAAVPRPGTDLPATWTPPRWALDQWAILTFTSESSSGSRIRFSAARTAS